MLILQNITKDYLVGGGTIRALRGISLNFRKSEFVSVLGPSGCGKTTLLNLIGGLDHYTQGDLIINDRSTNEYRDKDWDAYRNHSIGFVFQSYNLIPHQSVLANVELALTLSGVSKTERRKRALKVLDQVGLSDQVDKRPSQMSGGQMQRVAIARALINDPDILLADEPTGALDSETSTQVMALLREIAKDKLVIMVTHNAELAAEYSTRIIRLLDGAVTGDTDPYDAAAEETPRSPARSGSLSMSFATALSLSLNNLMTKKARTILTAFAGSIGIIGIALIMSLSNGIQIYIDRVQEDTLSSYPIEIDAKAADLSSLVSSLSGIHEEAAGGEAHGDDAVYSNVIIYDLMNSLTSADTQTNNLKAFKEYLDDPDCPVRQYASAVRYTYGMNFDIYTKDKNDHIVKSDVIELLESLMTEMYGGDYSTYFATMGDFYSQFEVWEEMLAGDGSDLISDTVKNQYDLLYGSWPQSYDETILVVDGNNEVSDLVLYALGLKTETEMSDFISAMMNGEQIGASIQSWSYEEICSHSFKLVMPSEYYRYDPAASAYTDMSETEAGMDYLFNSDDVGMTLKVVGIVRQNQDAVSGMMQGVIGYTSALTAHIIDAAAGEEIILRQAENPDIDVISGLPFASADAPEPTDAEKAEAVTEYISGLDTTEKAAFYTEIMAIPSDAYVEGIVTQNISQMSREYIQEQLTASYAQEMGVDPQTVADYISGMDDETLFAYVRDAMAGEVRNQYAEGVKAQLALMSADQLAAMAGAPLEPWQYGYAYENLLPPKTSDRTYEENMALLGRIDESSPSGVQIYAETFENKDSIADAIADYNASADEDDIISYTDYVALLMSSITTIINAISYVLIAFVAISLVVSSIMIGIITYISVLERTKEIGILRAIGASKRDISRVFNAETLIEGFISGIIGIGMTLLLIIPINMIIHRLTNIMSLNATLPVSGGISLVIISMILTFISGLIPSGIAARRDPVEALRTE